MVRNDSALDLRLEMETSAQNRKFCSGCCLKLLGNGAFRLEMISFFYSKVGISCADNDEMASVPGQGR